MKFDISEDEEEYEEEPENNESNKKIFYIIIGLFAILLLIILITILILNSGNKQNKKVPVTTPSTTITPSSTSTASPVTSPTEEKKVTIVEENSTTRPLAVIIDCESGANQAGLQESYINYELLIDDEITRCLAIFQNKNVSLVGPIRSTSTDFLDLALENDAILIHYGVTPVAEEDLIKYEVSNLNGMVDKTAFRRDTESVAPHNVYSRMAYINQALENVSFAKTSNNWQLLKYTTNEQSFQNLSGKQEATNISIVYSSKETRTYTYDSTNRYYMRFANKEAKLDRKTKSQQHYKNIIIVETEKETTDEGENLKITGTGTGYYITNGYAMKIIWAKENRNKKTIYKYEDGTEVSINDGNTFIEIVPKESTTIQ